MINRLILLLSLCAAIVIAVMLFFTTPTGIGPFGVFVFFVMVYIVMFGVALFGTRIFMRAVQRRKELRGKDYAYAALLAFWPIMVLLMISIGASNIVVSIAGATLYVAVGLLLINKLKWQR